MFQELKIYSLKFDNVAVEATEKYEEIQVGWHKEDVFVPNPPRKYKINLT
jgi:hypothetical protein